ncbi:MAG: hypothetical protein ACK5JD_02810, partial [Mangrovibacterium sp.]
TNIHMPKNSPLGVIIGALALAFGFAMVWYIWWLAIVSLLTIIATLIISGSNDDDGYMIPASEVKRIEAERFRLLNGYLTAEPGQANNNIQNKNNLNVYEYEHNN